MNCKANLPRKFVFIEVKIYVEPAILLGWADNKRKVPQCGTDFSISTPQILNSEFFLLLHQSPYPVYPVILLIDEERRDRFMPFPKIFAWSDMQTAFAKIWTLESHIYFYNWDMYIIP